MLELIDVEDVYLNALEYVYSNGRKKEDRTGVGTISCNGVVMQWDVSQQFFPILRTKYIWFKGLAVELAWFMKGDTNIKYLHDNGVHYWDAWGTKEMCAKFGRKTGDFGPTYGKQWRNFNDTDQLDRVCHDLMCNPDSRRIILNIWNPHEQMYVEIPPCCCFFQFCVRPPEKDGSRYVDMMLYQRSADMFLGVPFDQSQYSLFLILLCKVCSQEDKLLLPGQITHLCADAHIYLNHFKQVEEQLKRDKEVGNIYHRPKLDLGDENSCSLLDGMGVKGLEDWDPKTAYLIQYQNLGIIKAEVAI